MGGAVGGKGTFFAVRAPSPSPQSPPPVPPASLSALISCAGPPDCGSISGYEEADGQVKEVFAEAVATVVTESVPSALLSTAVIEVTIGDTTKVVLNTTSDADSESSRHHYLDAIS